MEELSVPLRSHGRRRDRRGRGIRGPLIPAGLPAHRTRREIFDEYVAQVAEALQARLIRPIMGLEVAVEEVPPSDPAPWEFDLAPLSRYFPADRISGAPHRIVLYRRVIETREPDVVEAIYQLLAFHIGEIAGIHPDDLLQ